MEEKTLKILGGVLVGVLVLNLVLFALRKISVLLFWIIIAVIAVLAWKVVPRMKEEHRRF